MPETTLVMTGRLEDFKLVDVLQVVGLSRQYTAVELRREDGRIYGTIWVKAGRVIGCEREGQRGRNAFYEMFGGSADVFVVSRLPEPSSYPQPLGSLASLLMEAIERAARPQALPPPPAPAAAVAKGSQVTQMPQRTPPLRAPAPIASARPQARRASGTTAPPPTIAGPRERGVAVAIASPKGGVGKTTITLNLALAVAQRGPKTIVIDADVNGDVLSLLGARDQAPCGAYDLLDRPDAIDEALRETAIPGLRILPAAGARLPPAATARRSMAAEWRALIDRARDRADLVLVDCPAGMFDTTADVLAACTHVVGVLQSEMIAARAAAMLERGLEALPVDVRPKLAGVVVNMFQGKSQASVEAFHHVAAGPRGPLLFETTIPRSDAFSVASLAGVPVRFAEPAGASPIAWLFEALASEVCGRTGLVDASAQAPMARFLR